MYLPLRLVGIATSIRLLRDRLMEVRSQLADIGAEELLFKVDQACLELTETHRQLLGAARQGNLPRSRQDLTDCQQELPF